MLFIFLIYIMLISLINLYHALIVNSYHASCCQLLSCPISSSAKKNIFIKAIKATIAIVIISILIFMMIMMMMTILRAIVVHAGVDDLGQGGASDSLTTGNAGARFVDIMMRIITIVIMKSIIDHENEYNIQ